MTGALRVGVLGDIAAGPPDPSNTEYWLRLACDELRAGGALAAPVEFVHAWGPGLPTGTRENIERAFAELHERDVLLVVGPAIGDNALVATPLADGYQLPAINWAGSEYARSEYMFQLQVGSHQDEPLVMLDYLEKRGVQRLGIIYDESPIGSGYLEALQHAAGVRGLQIAATESVAPTATQAEAQARQLVAHDADTCLYLGLGHCLQAVVDGLQRAGFDGERLMSSAGIRGYHPQFSASVEGWVYLDVWSESNTVLAQLRERHGLDVRQSFAAAKGYDLGRLVAHGLANADEASREGVRRGLERIKWLPAAEGEQGTLLGFGRWDRGALHGRYLVARRWENGESVPA